MPYNGPLMLLCIFRRFTRAVSLMAAFLGSLTVVRTVTGQTPVAVSDTAARQSLPTPLVIAGFPVPSHPVDWSHYLHMDECIDVAVWTEAMDRFDRVDRSSAIDEQRSRDTTEDNPWTPLPAATRDSTQRCLRRFSLSALPVFESAAMLRLAVTIGADTLVSALVAQQVAAVHGAPRGQAAVLDTAIQLLMRSPGIPGQPVAAHPSPAHVQLARRYVAQLEALGRPTLVQQMLADGSMLIPAEFALDVDTLLTHLRIERQRVRQLSPQEVQELYWLPLDTVQLVQDGREAHVRWFKTGAPDAFARFATVAQQTRRLGSGHPALLGTVAAPVTGASCFTSPATPTPTLGLTPQLHTSGVPSLVIFLDTPEGGEGDDSRMQLYRDLRRLHQDFPALRIVLVAILHGRYRQRWLQEHPAEEATFLHQELADSLGVPGSLCVVQPEYQALPNGWRRPLLPPLEQAYDLDDVNQYGGFLIDPQGRIVDAVGFTRVYPTILRHMQQRVSNSP